MDVFLSSPGRLFGRVLRVATTVLMDMVSRGHRAGER